jgi:hypothetical protein
MSKKRKSRTSTYPMRVKNNTQMYGFQREHRLRNWKYNGTSLLVQLGVKEK